MHLMGQILLESQNVSSSLLGYINMNSSNPVFIAWKNIKDC